MAFVGKSVARLDVVGKVKGETLYPGDYNFPDQAYMKVLFAQHPHAVIRNIDTSQAENIPGVLGVFTSKDVPVNEFGFNSPGPTGALRPFV